MAKTQIEKGNKFVTAGFGAVATVQTTIGEGFEKLVAKGEIARKDYREQFESVTDRVTTGASNILNLPTTKDIDALNEKLDRVIKKLAA